MKQHYDIIVIGGGTSGVVAAIQAAREGMSTLLVEKTEMLGGTITGAAVAYPGLFHAWTKQIIADPRAFSGSANHFPLTL